MRVSFGEFELDTETFELRNGGSPVHLEPQAFDVLAHLVRHRDRVVPKEELLDEIWGDRFVSDSALTSRIKHIRRALGDDGRAQRWIRTVHGRGYRFSDDVDPEQPARPGAASEATWYRGALPVDPNTLVGRDADLAALGDLLTASGTRLVTLTGPPGVGKTRLAVAAATAAQAHFADGIVFVDLTAVREPALVPGEVLGALGTGGADGPVTPARLARALARRELLLVLDNFEHVLEAAPTLAAALALATGPRVLVTSRERLHLHAEREFPVRPLGLPRQGDDSARVAAAPSVAMLLQAVRAFQPGFAMSATDHATLAEICVQLDGLPLALELAAARLRLFTPGELTSRLRHRLAELTSAARDVPARHRTLRAALAWSHDLLSRGEREVFRRFSVFVGGASLDAVERVCGSGDVIDTVASLIDKGMLQRRIRRDDVAELVMLESLREFAAEQLVEHGEANATRARQASHFAELAVRAEAAIGDAGETGWIDVLGFARGNLHSALDHATATGDADLALPLAAALGWYCYFRGRLGEGRAAMARALLVGERRGDSDAHLRGALLITGVIALAQGDHDGADDLLGRVLAMADARGGRRHAAIGTAFRGHLARARGRHDEAVEHHVHAGELFVELGSREGFAWSRHDLGLLARHRRDDEAAAAHLRAGLAPFRELGYRWGVACSTWALATVELRRARLGAAAALLVEAVECFEASGDDRGLAQCLEAISAVACGRGRPGDAARLLGSAEALRERLEAPLPAEEHADHESLVRRVRHALGPEDAERARCAGRQLPRPAALALAYATLATPVTEAEQPQGGTAHGP